MGESDDSRQQSEGEDPEHPLKEGIDEAKAGHTASLEDILSELDWASAPFYTITKPDTPRGRSVVRTHQLTSEETVVIFTPTASRSLFRDLRKKRGLQRRFLSRVHDALTSPTPRAFVEKPSKASRA